MCACMRMRVYVYVYTLGNNSYQYMENLLILLGAVEISIGLMYCKLYMNLWIVSSLWLVHTCCLNNFVPLPESQSAGSNGICICNADNCPS